MAPWLLDAVEIGIAALLVAVNGFFVAAEFALVKVRPAALDELIAAGRPFARTARWLYDRLDASLSACQLGITMASLGLGWVGEPALASLFEPLFRLAGLQSQALLHGVAFTVAFSIITAAHLVIGEQTPKIFAIRQPERLALWCALPLKWFYYASYPFLIALNATSSFLLRRMGVDGAHSGSEGLETEIRALIRTAHAEGAFSRMEHKLLEAAFAFDDIVCRRVMIARGDVVSLDIGFTLDQCVEVVNRMKHTRYPVVEGSLDHVVGVAHLKDFLGANAESFDLRTLVRPPHYVPETLAISRLLRHFQATRQHMAFVVDEYGTVIGAVTLENVLEQIVGRVEDEFDAETPDVVPDGPGRFLIQGNAPLHVVARGVGLPLANPEVDTLSGYLVNRLGRFPVVGDSVTLEGGTAEILEIRRARAIRVRVTLDP